MPHRLGSSAASSRSGIGRHRLQHVAPAFGGVDVTGTKRTPLQVAELVKYEQRVIAGAAEVAVVGRAFLSAKGGADAGVHVEHDPLHRTASMDAVDPAPGQVGQRREVRLLHQHLGLKPTHLAGGCSILRYRATTDDPTHGWISAKPVGIIESSYPASRPKTDWRN